MSSEIAESPVCLEVLSNIFIYAHVHTTASQALQHANSIHAAVGLHHLDDTSPLRATHTVSEQLQVQASFTHNAENFEAKNPTASSMLALLLLPLHRSPKKLIPCSPLLYRRYPDALYNTILSQLPPFQLYYYSKKKFRDAQVHFSHCKSTYYLQHKQKKHQTCSP